MPFQFTGNQVSGDDAACLSVDDDQLHHFMAGMHFNSTQSHLPFKRLVGSDQQLLSGLTSSIECTLNLGSTERTVAEQSTIFPCERNTLCYALVNDAGAYFSKPVYISFAGTVIATFDGIVKQTID